MNKNISDFCKEYQDFIDWQNEKISQYEIKTPKWKRIIHAILLIKNKKQKVVVPMTMNQARFVNFLLENSEDISSIGNLEAIFVEVRKFIRHNG